MWDHFFAFVQNFSSLWGCVCITPSPPSILSLPLVFHYITRLCSLTLMLCGICVSDCIPLSAGLCAGSYLQSPGIRQSSVNMSRCNLTYLWWKGGLTLVLTDHCFWEKTAIFSSSQWLTYALSVGLLIFFIYFNFYCNMCFIEGIWNQTHNISKAT